MSNSANKNEQKPEKYYYIRVRYDDAPEDSYAYNYISKNLKIKPNDRVLVPRGDSQATGHVVDCAFFAYEEVPYPVEYTKYIIKKIDEDFQLDEQKRTVPNEAGSFYDQLANHIVKENGQNILKDFDVDKFRNKPVDSNIKYYEGFAENIIPLLEDKDLKLFIIGTMRNLNPGNMYESVRKIEDFYKNSDHCTKSISNEVIDELVSILDTYDVSDNQGETTAEEKLTIEKDKLCDLYFKFALSMILYPKNVEVVKLGIALIGIFKYTKQDEIMELFLNLSLCEELAKYMAFLFSNQEEGKELLLDAAKSTKGWGRINYIEKFDFLDYDMLDWFLMEGYQNEIDSLYTSALAAQKIDLLDIMKNCIKSQNSSNEKKSAKSKTIINNILHMLADLNEEPNMFEEYEEENSIYPTYNLESMMDIILEQKEQLYGYSEYYRLLIAYISFVNEKNAQIFDGVSSIEMEGPEYSQNIAERIAQIEEIFNSAEVYEAFKKLISDGAYEDCDIICRALYDFPEIDVNEELFERFSKAPLDMFVTYAHLMENDDYHDRVYNIMKEADDWNKYKGNPEPIADSKAITLRYIVNDLELYPFYEDFFINIGLNSYDYYCRYAALSTLMFWKQETEKPIYAFPLSILESLLNLKTKEVMKDNKKLLMELLSDLKDLKKDAAKENSNIIKIIDNAIEDEDLDNYEEPKIIFK